VFRISRGVNATSAHFNVVNVAQIQPFADFDSLVN